MKAFAFLKSRRDVVEVPNGVLEVARFSGAGAVGLRCGAWGVGLFSIVVEFVADDLMTCMAQKTMQLRRNFQNSSFDMTTVVNTWRCYGGSGGVIANNHQFFHQHYGHRHSTQYQNIVFFLFLHSPSP